jgi:glycosyltransferase involved in cell wall biosynthesis
MSGSRYIIISPVKDEAAYVEETIRCVLSQTVRPAQWVIVDDGSRDNTRAILEKYRRNHDWIKVIRLQTNVKRQPGSSVIQAFNKGYESIKDEQIDFIVKLDCDLKFERDYFEKILSRFRDDAKLGIASGVYLEDRGKGFSAVKMPDYHAAGASKVVRTACFKAIGGFIAEKGWDTIDEIKAQLHGWKTGHFKEIIFYHLKNEGTGIGFVRTNRMHGEIYYLTGGSKLFFALKLAHRMVFGTPFLIGGIMMLIGYLSLSIKGTEVLISETEADVYRDLLKKRIMHKIGMFN